MISSFGLLSIHFRQFVTEFWPLNDRMSLPLNILNMNNEFRLNCAYALILMTSSLGLLSDHFRLFVTELWPLNVRISFPLSILYE